MVSYAYSELLLVFACVYAVRKLAIHRTVSSIYPYAVTAFCVLALAAALGAIRFGFGVEDEATLLEAHRLVNRAVGLIGLPFMAFSVAGYLGQSWAENRFRLYAVTFAVFYAACFVSGYEDAMVSFVGGASTLSMVVMGLFALIILGRPSGAGIMLLSILFLLNALIISPSGSPLFGIDRWHIYHCVLAFWAFSMANILSEERPIV